MKKVLKFSLITALLLLSLWQLGGFHFLAYRFMFVPDYDQSYAAEFPATYSPRLVQMKTTVIAENLNIPWEVVALPDGRFLVTERPGQVLILDQGRIKTITPVLHLGEGGLLGMSLHPDFGQNPYVYLYYTYRQGLHIYNRVSRFIFSSDRLVDEQILMDQIPGSVVHNGGRIKFGPDQCLYITTGDALNKASAQDISSMAGKILRIHADGSIPEDNPFPGSPVFSYGHRNPQGLAWHPVTGALYSSEHGPLRQDEINLISGGQNYGWPIVSCAEGPGKFQDPVLCYADFTLAPSGMSFIPSPGHPREGHLLVAGLRGNMLMYIILDQTGKPMHQIPLLQDHGRLRTVVFHHGFLYVATNNRDGRGQPHDHSDILIKVELIYHNGD